MLTSEKKSGMVMMVLSAMLFSFKPVFAKLAYRYGVQPEVLLGMRMLIAVPLFWLFNVFISSGEKITLTKKDILSFAAAGFVGFFLAAEMSFFALAYIDASINTMIIYTYPSIVTILSCLILNESIDRTKILTLAIVFSGTLFVLNVFNASHIDISAIGVALSFGSAVSFSLYYILHRILSRNIPTTKLTTYLVTAGGLFVIGYWHFTDIDQPYQVWLYAFGLASISTLFPFLLLGEGVKRVGASNAAIYSAVGPVSTITLAHIVLGEKLTSPQLIGAALIIIGIITLGTKRIS